MFWQRLRDKRLKKRAVVREWKDLSYEEKQALKGRMKIECINNNTRVQIELDNISIDFLIETLLELKNKPGLHHFNFDSDTGYSLGYMTQDSLDLILNNRDKYDE